MTHENPRYVDLDNALERVESLREMTIGHEPSDIAWSECLSAVTKMLRELPRASVMRYERVDGDD